MALEMRLKWFKKSDDSHREVKHRPQGKLIDLFSFFLEIIIYIVYIHRLPFSFSLNSLNLDFLVSFLNNNSCYKYFKISKIQKKTHFFTQEREKERERSNYDTSFIEKPTPWKRVRQREREKEREKQETELKKMEREREKI